MKAAALSDIKNELIKLPPKRLVELCLRLARFKKENKELLAFLLFDAEDEQSYVESIKMEIDQAVEELNTTNWYFLKKGLRKILRSITKYGKFTNLKESEVEMLLHFVKKMYLMGIVHNRNKAINNLYETQVVKTTKLIDLLHEDLQFDYKNQLGELF